MAAISAAWSRVTGRGGSGKKTLPSDMMRITHSGVLDIPKELLTPVVEASNNEEDRPEIMKHVRECLAEPAGKHWRRVYGGLVLVEALVKNGSPALLSETAEGRHFDLVQRLSFLEEFDYSDTRVKNNIRRKAEALRKEVVPLLQSVVSQEDKKEDTDDIKDTTSTCSPGSTVVTQSTTSTSNSAPSSSSATGFGSEDICDEMFRKESADPSKRLILNNIVSVGHTDDTTSESEGGEDKARAPVRYSEPRRMSAKERNERSRRAGGSSSDSDDAPQDRKPQSKVVVQAPAQTVDLLDL